jgi:hypothetical protein
LKGGSAAVSAPVFTASPSAFLYTLIYRKDGPGLYSPIDPKNPLHPKNTWTFTWDGVTGSVNRGVVHTLSYLTTQSGTAEDGATVAFHLFAETAPLEGRIRKWALEVDPRPYLYGRPDLLCTVGYFFDRDASSWVEEGFAIKEV